MTGHAMTPRRRRLARVVMIALPRALLALLLVRIEIRFEDDPRKESLKCRSQET